MKNSTLKPYVCDDWGLSYEINRAILSLARKGLVERVSLVANSLYLDSGLKELIKLDVQLSLNLNFTHGKPLSEEAKVLTTNGKFSRFKTAVALLRGKNREAFIAELRAQNDKLLFYDIRTSYLEARDNIQIWPGFLPMLSGELQTLGYKIIRARHSLKSPLHFFAVQLIRVLSPKSLRAFQFANVKTLSESTWKDEKVFRKTFLNSENTPILLQPSISANDKPGFLQFTRASEGV